MFFHHRQLHDSRSGMYARSGISCGTRFGSGAASITSAICIAGSERLTASSDEANCAPSMMSPHLISSAIGLPSNPNFSDAIVGQELGAGFVSRIVKFLARMIVAEMFGVCRGEKGALMMIEPPGKQRRA